MTSAFPPLFASFFLLFLVSGSRSGGTQQRLTDGWDDEVFRFDALGFKGISFIFSFSLYQAENFQSEDTLVR